MVKKPFPSHFDQPHLYADGVTSFGYGPLTLKIFNFFSNIKTTNFQTDQNYASYYEYRSENSNACLQTKHHDWPDDTIPSGTTYFSKVRLSLRTLQVIEDDRQFATTTGRLPQTYGSAGDCYSTVPCPQGRFSINFERTKFRIRPKTDWETRGQNATMLYHAKVS